MSEKLARKKIPDNHSFSDFKCFGPVATKDGELEGSMLCDMGCFDESQRSTNKYYFGCVCQSSLNQEWFVYFQWGKVGGPSDFQFYKCSSQEEAKSVYAKQLHSKNDKRGEWTTIAGIKTLKAKKGKDCYLVRALDSRDVNLIDARNISSSAKIPKKAKSPTKSDVHPQTFSLLLSLNSGSLSYTRTSLVGGNVPSQMAIDEARLLLGEASKVLSNKKLAKDSKEKELTEITNILYSKIPKVKKKYEDWLLSADNIFNWTQDLDAFEGCVGQSDVSVEEVTGFPQLDYVEHSSTEFKEICEWIQSATRNKHSHLSGGMKVKNVWLVHMNEQKSKFEKYCERIEADKTKVTEKPLHQPSSSHILHEGRGFNMGTLFHGSRSVNIGPILKSKLILPRALKGVQINGAAIGPGLYFADDWKKSAGYCSLDSGYWSRGSGKISGRGAFMFINSVCLGRIHAIQYAKYFDEPPKGFHSVAALGGGSFANNEFVVYNEDANLIRYLIEFEA